MGLTFRCRRTVYSQGYPPSLGIDWITRREQAVTVGSSSRSAAKQSHDFTVGEHVSGHGIHHGISVARSRMDLWNVERIEPKYIPMLSQRRARRYIGCCA